MLADAIPMLFDVVVRRLTDSSDNSSSFGSMSLVGRLSPIRIDVLARCAYRS